MTAPSITVVVVPPTPITAWPVIVGPRGPAGPAGASGYVHTQSVPLATWTITNPLGRIPAVQVYVNGKQVDTDIDATLPQVVITFPAPAVGVAICT